MSLDQHRLRYSETDFVLGEQMLGSPEARASVPLTAARQAGVPPDTPATNGRVLLALLEGQGRLERDLATLRQYVADHTLEGRCRRLWAWLRRLVTALG